MPTLEYEIDSKENSIVYEMEEGQNGATEIVNGIPIIYVNRAGARFMARLFAQLAEGRFSAGFHVHLGANLDPEATESLLIVLDDTLPIERKS